MWSALTNRIDVRRRTAILLDATTAGQTMAWTRQPVRAAVVEVRVHDDGTSGSGSITITGTSGGVAATETLVATGPGYLRTSRTWTALAGLTTSDLADELTAPSISARASGKDGSSLEDLQPIVLGWPASVQAGGVGGGTAAGGNWANDRRAGRSAGADATMVIAYDETWSPRRGDLVTDDTGSRWEVIGFPRIGGTDMVRLWNVRLKAHESE